VARKTAGFSWCMAASGPSFSPLPPLHSSSPAGPFGRERASDLPIRVSPFTVTGASRGALLLRQRGFLLSRVCFRHQNAGRRALDSPFVLQTRMHLPRVTVAVFLVGRRMTVLFLFLVPATLSSLAATVNFSGSSPVGSSTLSSLLSFVKRGASLMAFVVALSYARSDRPAPFLEKAPFRALEMFCR